MSSAMLQITPIMPVTILMTGLEDLMPELIETAHITTSITVNKDPDFISYYPPKESALLILLKYSYIIVRVVVVVIFEIIDEFGLLRCGGGVEVPEGIFYTNADGAIAHGFCGRFYAGEDGRIVTGWVTAEGVTCYCQGDGRIATGRMRIGGVEYEFNEYGALIGEKTE